MTAQCDCDHGNDDRETEIGEHGASENEIGDYDNEPFVRHVETHNHEVKEKEIEIGCDYHDDWHFGQTGIDYEANKKASDCECDH
jgi:hypothetical protein